jgi:DNA ligase-associated metallophosphoesterase
MLPPYDTPATLDRLEAVIDRHGPARVVCLGDSFHDEEAAQRVTAQDQARIRALTAATEWIWVAGNHDPEPPGDWGGEVREEVSMGSLMLRHEALSGFHAGEISGHYHPKASVRVRSKRLSARCFIDDGRRLVLPAFGAYAGGLNVLDPVLRALFPDGFQVHLLGRKQVHRYPASALIP